MKLWLVFFTVLITSSVSFRYLDSPSLKSTYLKGFNIKKDLLLAQFDCKTDVDDLHTVAAFYTLMASPKFSAIKYHAVAGTYGVQKGLYVPPNDLFQLAFGENWTDAHADFKGAVEKVMSIVKTTLENKGDVWIAEAGQSDFSAALVKMIQSNLPKVNIGRRIHIVQHSNWNEKVTSSDALAFVKENTDYQKIPDGNAVANGSPGFRSPDVKWENKVTDANIKEVWELAVSLGLKYNGKEKRYNNKAVAAGGLDFSDLAETCWILGIQDIKDANHFFELYAQ